MQIRRRTLFESELLHAVHVRARPSFRSGAANELECQHANVLVLPLSGVFAKYDAPRRSVIASAACALLIARDVPYRTSFPGVTRVIEVPDAKLFFAEDRPRALAEPLRAWLNEHDGAWRG